jgi:WD40 repeat protein/tetratricopeptide (TPR) repeat protein
MAAQSHGDSSPPDREQRLDAIIASYLDALDAGKEVSRQAILDANADLVPELREFFDDQDRLNRIAPSPGAGRPLPPSPPAAIGRFGDYELLEEVARGGMGIIYKARQIGLGRIVALKMVLAGQLASPAGLARFHREAEAVASLDHPHITPIYEIGEHDGLPFFTMKFMDGGSLSPRAHQFSDDPGAAARIVEKVARAIHYAHEHGILHRDLKPSNILLDAHGEPQVSDFGLARQMSVDSALTQSDEVLGTPSYMAPEQASGPRSRVGVAADVYGLGALLYELLTARPPFKAATSIETLRLVVEREPSRPSGVNARLPADLETICLKCLRKEPESRYASALELAEDLRRFLAGVPILARQASTAERAWRWCRRNPALASTLGSIAVLLVAITAVSAIAALSLRAERNHTIENLRGSYLAQARASRLGGREGQRLRALQVLRDAAAIRPGLDARNEAIACLALPDVDVEDAVARVHPSMHRVALAPDFKRFAAGNMAGDIEVRELDGRLLARLSGRGRSVGALHFSGDGSRLLARLRGDHEAGDCLIWDLKQSKELVFLEGVAGGANAVQLDHDGGTLVIGRWDGKIALHDASTGAPIREIGDGPRPTYIRWGPAETKLAVGFFSSPVVHVRDRDSGELEHALVHEGTVFVFAWHPREPVLAVGTFDGRILLWNTATGERLRAVPAKLHGSVHDLTFHPGGTMLASRSYDGTVRLWDAVNGEELLRGTGRLGGALRFSPGGDRLGPFQSEDDLGWWKVAWGQECSLVYERFSQARSWSGVADFSPDGRLLASVGYPGVVLWDNAAGRRAALLPAQGAHSALFWPGRGLIVCGAQGLHLWPIESAPAAGPRLAVGPPRELGVGLGSGFQFAAISGDKRTLAAMRGGEAIVIDLEGGAREICRVRHPGLDRLSLSGSGRWLATSTWGGRDAKVWSCASGELELSIPAGNASVNFSGDDRWLVVGSGWSYELHDLPRRSSRRLISKSDSMAGEVPGPAAFDIGAKVVAVVSPLSVVRLFEVESGREIATLESKRADLIRWLRFSPDGSRLSAASEFRSELWDLRRIRAALAELGLDWESPPLPPEPADPQPLEVSVALGDFADPARWSEDPPADLVAAAVPAADASVAASPAAAEPHQRRSRLRELAGRHHSAIADLDAALAAEPGNAAFLERRASLHQALGRRDSALLDLSRALEIGPARWQARWQRALLLEDMGDLAGAAADYAALLEKRGDFYGAAGRLAWALVAGPKEIRDPERARALAERNARRAPFDPEPHRILGAALLLLDHPREALRSLERGAALNAEGPNGWDYLLLSACHSKLGDRARAEELCEKALAWKDWLKLLPAGKDLERLWQEHLPEGAAAAAERRGPP